jgi:hypothetical protein
MKRIVALTVCLIIALSGAIVKGGPYREAGICSYIGPDHKATTPWDPNRLINPMFRGWATNYTTYKPTPTPTLTSPRYPREIMYFDPTMALGPSYSNISFDTVSLGDLDQNEINAGASQGQIILSFNEIIRDQNGYDFVVFENSFRVEANLYFCEFAYVDVSSNSTDFARFPSVELEGLPDTNTDITQVYNLAGKHPNMYNKFTGTPFDLSEIRNEPNVVAGLVDLNNILYVRIVDIPGSGNYYDNAQKLIDPCTWPDWDYYDANHPIYDAWPTRGSDGFDLEAVGVLKPQQYGGDINLDGIVDYEDLDIFAQCWLQHFGQDNYLSRCDLAEPKDLIVNFKDLAEFAKGWRKMEQWR